ncbi:hypothetical protein BU16DRAFT_579757 [Lophium mytilinum]|uniref:Uncharacterized protein n=1 Tax=Lophium mytilinum TaxID=390894 RepID=A0A6A6R1U2_9PEZI|nr:hypothetical protein BU16DRAFT_579757 [Lophium mytilinum]
MPIAEEGQGGPLLSRHMFRPPAFAEGGAGTLVSALRAAVEAGLLLELCESDGFAALTRQLHLLHAGIRGRESPTQLCLAPFAAVTARTTSPQTTGPQFSTLGFFLRDQRTAPMLQQRKSLHLSCHGGVAVCAPSPGRIWGLAASFNVPLGAPTGQATRGVDVATCLPWPASAQDGVGVRAAAQEPAVNEGTKAASPASGCQKQREAGSLRCLGSPVCLGDAHACLLTAPVCGPVASTSPPPYFLAVVKQPSGSAGPEGAGGSR